MRVGVVGVGNVGARVVRQLLSSSDVSSIVVSDSKAGRADEVVRLIKESHVTASATPWDGATVTVLASAPGDHRNIAQTALRQGSHVVSVSDSIPDVRALLELDYEAASRGRSVVVGAAMAPGLTGLLTRLAARPFDMVEEIHVAAAGTGGPACARQHHAALGGDAVDWRDGAFIDRRGRSGRELVFFPEPIGGRDCYRAALPDALLLAPEFAGVERVTARLSATRRDRVTALLPMLRRPHADGGPGAVRVEVRGIRASGERDTEVLSAVDHPSVAAAVVAAVATQALLDESWGMLGSRGLAAVQDPAPWLRELARRGVKAARFSDSA